MITGMPLQVIAHLDTGCVGLVEQPCLLDGPLAWAAAMTAIAAGVDLPPITRAHAPDLDLPLARWEQHGTWGWCASQADLAIDSYTASEIRRKPATAAMARYTRDAKHHCGLGPHKARDTAISVTWIRTATWHVLATDRDRLADLLALVTHLGRHTALGYGHVHRWIISDHHDPGAWRDRPMPGPDEPIRAYRPPYHHPTRQVVT